MLQKVTTGVKQLDTLHEDILLKLGIIINQQLGIEEP
jgi:hypothetical protein